MTRLEFKISCLILLVAVWISVAIIVRSPKNHLLEDSSTPKRNVKSIKLSDFAEYYKTMSANSDKNFLKEYQELFYDENLEQRSSDAVLPCNSEKNRYSNILPYDHSRFRLQLIDTKECSDYINANYLPGHHSPTEFIAAQGPLENTRNDFWRMVWESDAKAIVMLTRLQENGKEKCNHYWPHGKKPKKYGEITVTILKETFSTDWVVRELSLEKGDSKRVIQHFHYTSWPDFGVPSTPEALMRFIRFFREKIQDQPVVVHCSAGIGRTGTFITLDRLFHQIDRGDEYIDVFNTVQELRNGRFWMVQSPDQYVYIHKCILEVLNG